MKTKNASVTLATSLRPKGARPGTSCALALRSPTSPDQELVIAPDLDYTRYVSETGTTFTFPSSKDCPGYVIEISNWRLRKAPQDLNHPPYSADDLGTSVGQELRRVLGDGAFRNTDRAKAACESDVALAAMDQPCLMPRSMRLNEAAVRAERSIFAAVHQDMFSPEVAFLGMPLAHLVHRDRIPYIADKDPWVNSIPPRLLVHCARSGFKSWLKWGIFAVPTIGDEVWVVSRFSQCGVELHWNRGKALRDEFPDVAACLGKSARPGLTERQAEQIAEKAATKATRKVAGMKQGSGAHSLEKAQAGRTFEYRPDFHRVRYRNKTLSFGPQASILVRALFRAFDSGVDDGWVHQQKLRIIDKRSFRDVKDYLPSDHAARKCGLVEPDSRGSFRLHLDGLTCRENTDL